MKSVCFFLFAKHFANTAMPNHLENSATDGASKSLDPEMREAQLFFNAVWSELESEYAADDLQFPKEIFWLNGSPGAGKGTQTRYIMTLRGITAPPIQVSSLLKSKEAQKLIDAGKMVNDREVINLVLRKLIDPIYQRGAIVDGFPRTQVQVHCLKLLYQKLKDRRRRSLNTPLADVYLKPIFHIIVLFVDENISVQRQLNRGQAILKHNEQVEKSGMGEIVPIRKTDLTTAKAAERYYTFKEVTYEALKTLQKVFQYHYIDANGTIEEVQQHIINELRYQSSLELDQETYDHIADIPIASEVTIHARQELVRRLIEYEHKHNELFQNVISVIKDEFIDVIHRHSITGLAYINSHNPIFRDKLARAMLIDTFSERGYHVAAENRSYQMPVFIDPETHIIENKEIVVYRFKIQFVGTEIRYTR